MKLKAILRTTVLLTALLVASGCKTRICDLTVVATQNVELEKVDIDKMPQKKRVIGKDSNFMFLFIPLGLPSLEDAVEDALEKGDGDLMVDAVVYSKGWWFLIGQNGIEVRGNVVKTRGEAIQ